MEHELIIIGSIINHLPPTIYHLYSILQQNYIGQYEETGDSPLCYRKENNSYVSDSVTMTPVDATVSVAYEDVTEEGQESGDKEYRFRVRMISEDRHAYTLTLPCNKAFLQQYYYPVRRFLRSNPSKYIRPGIRGPLNEGTTIAVLDTEMQRPYITQFSGCLLRYRNGNWVISETERMNVYVRLPEGVRVDPFVWKVTGLSRAFLDENGVDEEEALDRITEFLSTAEFVCGHAVLSDVELLRERYLLAGRIADPSVLGGVSAKDLAIANIHTPSNTVLGSLFGIALPEAEESPSNQIPDCLLRNDLIDTQILMEYLYELSGMIKLERAAELAGVVSEGDVFHDARTDAEVTARLLIKLWPEFVERFGVLPIVKAAMMHAPKDAAVLNPILGKRITEPKESSNTGSGKRKRSGSVGSHSIKRSVRVEQQRKRKRIT